MTDAVSEQISAIAARCVADEGMEYAAAKRWAAKEVLGRGARNAELPSNEQLEDEVRDYLALFHADTQPLELRALREIALQWMHRLSEFRPHLSGAVWRGTATRHSAIHLDLYCDDAKGAEIALVNLGINFDGQALDRPGREPLPVLSLSCPCPGLMEPATIHLMVQDLDDQRGALKPDTRGHSWRGDATALTLRLQEDELT